jgi:Flp pilus assembly pilin Flp
MPRIKLVRKCNSIQDEDEPSMLVIAQLTSVRNTCFGQIVPMMCRWGDRRAGGRTVGEEESTRTFATATNGAAAAEPAALRGIVSRALTAAVLQRHSHVHRTSTASLPTGPLVR